MAGIGAEKIIWPEEEKTAQPAGDVKPTQPEIVIEEPQPEEPEDEYLIEGATPSLRTDEKPAVNLNSPDLISDPQDEQAFPAQAMTPSLFDGDPNPDLAEILRNRDLVGAAYPAFRPFVNQLASEGIPVSQTHEALAMLEDRLKATMKPEELDAYFGRTPDSRWVERFLIESNWTDKLSRELGITKEEASKRLQISKSTGLSLRLLSDPAAYKKAIEGKKISDSKLDAVVNNYKIENLQDDIGRSSSADRDFVLEKIGWNGKNLTDEQKKQLEENRKARKKMYGEVADLRNVIYTNTAAEFLGSSSSLVTQQFITPAPEFVRYAYGFFGLPMAAGFANPALADTMAVALPGGTGALTSALGAIVKGAVNHPIAAAVTLGGYALTGAAFEHTMKLEGGMLYDELLDAGISEKLSAWLSLVGGALNGYIEIGNMGLMLNAISGGGYGRARDMLMESVGGENGLTTRFGKARLKSWVAKSLKNWALNYIKSAGSEGLEEYLQAAVSEGLKELANWASGKSNRSFKDVLSAIHQQGWGGLTEIAKGMVLTSVPGTAINAYGRYRESAQEKAAAAQPKLYSDAELERYKAELELRAEEMPHVPSAEISAEPLGDTATQGDLKTAAPGFEYDPANVVTGIEDADMKRAENSAAPEEASTSETGPETVAAIERTDGEATEAETPTPQTETPEPTAAETTEETAQTETKAAEPESRPADRGRIAAARREMETPSTVYVSCDSMDAYLQSLPENERETLREALHMRRVTKTGEYIMRAKDFVAAGERFKGLEEAVAEDMRRGWLGVTNKELSQRKSDIKAREADPMEGNSPIAVEAREVRSDMEQKLVAAGLTQEQAEIEANLHAHAIFGFSRLYGVDPVTGNLTGEVLSPKGLYSLLEIRPAETTTPGETTLAQASSIARQTVSEEVEAQIEAVRRRFENTQSWLKAPNGKNSNLSERQWLITRTRNFLRWFGNWMFDGKQKLEAIDLSEHTKIIDESGNEIDLTTAKTKDIKRWLSQQYLGRTVEINSDGSLVGFEKDKLGDSLKLRNRASNDFQQHTPYALLNKIIEKSVFLCHVPVDQQAKHKGLLGQDIYLSVVQVGAKNYAVKLSLDVEQETRNVNYKGHKIAEIKIEPFVVRVLSEETPDYHARSSSKFILNDVLNNVKNGAQGFLGIEDPFKHSAILDENGEPKVVYHQTSTEFSEFDTRHQGAGSTDYETPYGIFLKPTDGNIGLQGNIQMALFASITNPFAVKAREQIRWQLRGNAAYVAAQDGIKANDVKYNAQYEALERAWDEEAKKTKAREMTPELERLDAEIEAILEKWRQENSVLERQAKEALTAWLKQNGYDGVIIENDKGSFGRSVKTYIALEPNQVKSVDNRGTFDTGENIFYQEAENERRLNEDIQNWVTTIDAFLDNPEGINQGKNLTVLRQTPLALVLVGAKNRALEAKPRMLRKMMLNPKKHQLSSDLVKQIPGALVEPVMILQDAKEDNALVVLLDLKKDGRSLIVPVSLEVHRGNRPTIINLMRSAYDLDAREANMGKESFNEGWILDQINEGKLLYIDEEKTQAWTNEVSKNKKNLSKAQSARLTSLLQMSRSLSTLEADPQSGSLYSSIKTKADLVKARQASGNTLYQSAAPANTLITTHGIDVSALEKAFDNFDGQLPMPSLAIAKRGQQGATHYGEITLIGDRNMVDPQQDRTTDVYDTDMWSPTLPRPEYKLDRAMRKEMSSLVGNIFHAWPEHTDAGRAYELDYLLNDRNVPLARIIDAATLANPFEAEYISRMFGEKPAVVRDEQGHVDELATDRALRDQLYRLTNSDTSQYHTWVEGLFRPLAGEALVQVGRKMMPYTVENVLEAMKKKAKLASQDTLTFGPGKVRAAAAKKLKTVAAMHKAEGRLASKVDFETWKKTVGDPAFNEAHAKIAEALTKQEEAKGYHPNPFDILDDAARALSDYVTGKRSLTSILGSEEIDSETQQVVDHYKDVLAEAKTEYFEAKPRRLVSVGEFRAAAVPSSIPAALRQKLEEHGVKVYEYPDGDQTARQQIVEQAAQEQNVFFQIIGEFGAARLSNAQQVRANLSTAREMESAGKDPKAVRYATGWERGADGKWRYEIMDGELKTEKVFELEKTPAFVKGLDDLSAIGELENVFYERKHKETLDILRKQFGDEKMNLYLDEVELLLKNYDVREIKKMFSQEYQRRQENLTRAKKGPRLSEVYINDELYKAYPNLKKCNVTVVDRQEMRVTSGTGDALGIYHPFMNRIYLLKYLSADEMRSVLIHEIQHAIQQYEGFAKGGPPEIFQQRRQWYDQQRADLQRQLDAALNAIGTPEVGFDEFTEQSLKDVRAGKKTMEEHWQDVQRFKDESDHGARIRELEKEIEALDNQYNGRGEMLRSDWENYDRLAGEVESNNASARSDMTEEQRRETTLSETEKYGRDEQIMYYDEDVLAFSTDDVAEDSLSYWQDQQQEPRGSITFKGRLNEGGTAVIDLFKAADASTFIHESAHFLLQSYLDFGRMENAPAALKQDLGVILDFLGVKDASEIGTEQHEKWARTVELYFMEGEAPTTALGKVFARMKRWLLEIYHHARHLHTEITPEVRDVLDRLFAGMNEEDAEVATLNDLRQDEEAAAEAVARMEAEEAQEQQEAAKPKTQNRRQASRVREALKRAAERRRKAQAELKAKQQERKLLKKEIAKILKKIKAAMEDKDVIWAIREKIRGVLAGYTLKNPSRQKLVQAMELYNYLIDHPGEVSIENYAPADRMYIEMLGTTMLPDMTLGELRALGQHIEELREEGKKAYEEWKAARQQRRDQMWDECFAALGEIPSTEGKAIRGARDLRKEYKGIRGKIEGAKDWAYAATLNSQRLMDWIGNGKGLFKSAWTKWLISRPNIIHDTFLRNQNDRYEKFDAVLQANGLSKFDLGRTRVIDGQKYTIDEMLSVYALLQNEKGRKALLFGNFKGLTDPEGHAARIVQSLTREELNIAEAILQDYEDNFDRLNKVFIKVFNEGMDKEERYSPMKRLEYTNGQGVVDAESQETLEGRMYNSGHVASLEDGFLIRRMEISEAHQQPVDLGLVSIWSDQVTAQEHTAAFAEYAGDLANFLKRRNSVTGMTMAKAVRMKYGPEAWNSVVGYSNLIILNEARQAHGVMNKISNKLVRAMSMVYIAGNLGGPLKQVASLPRFWLTAGPTRLVAHIGKWMVDPAGYMEEAYRLDPQLKERKPNAAYASMRIDPTVMSEANYRSYQALKLLMWLLGAMDRAVAAIGWRATYEAELARGASQMDAHLAAQRAVALTQQVPNAKDMPAFWREGTGIAKLMMVFSSNAIPIWGMTVYDLAQAVQRGQWPAAFTTTVALSLAAIATMFASHGLPSGDDDDSLLDWMVDAFTEQTITSLPIIGKEMFAAYDELINRNKRGTTYSALVTPIARTIQGFQRITSDKADEVMPSGLTRRTTGIFQLMEGLSLMFYGLPVTMGRRLWTAWKSGNAGEALRIMLAWQRQKRQKKKAAKKAVSW